MYLIQHSRGKRFWQRVSHAITPLLVVVTIVWSVTGSLVLLPNFAQAAVTEVTSADNFETVASPANSIVILDFALTANSSEKLSTLKFTIANVSGITASDFNDDPGVAGGVAWALFQDTDAAAGDELDGGTDTMVGTLAQGSVNIGSVSTMTIVGGVSLPTSMTGRGTVEFFLAAVLDASAAQGNGFTVNVAAGTDTYVLNSGTVSATTYTTPTITVDATAPTATGAGGPPDGQQFVPPDVQIDRVMSEEIDGNSLSGQVTLKRCTAADQSSAAAACATLDATNLCTSTSLSALTRITCAHGPLEVSKWYAFTLGTGVVDAVGNALASALVYRFKTAEFFGGSGGSNFTPPHVISSYPRAGQTSIPLNSNFFATFSEGPEGDMLADGTTNAINNASNISLQKVVSFSPDGTDLCASGCTLTWSSSTRTIKIDPPSNLLASAEYELCLANNIRNSASQTMPGQFCSRFQTGSGTDTTAPALRTTSPTSPAHGATGVSRYLGDMAATFNEELDPTTVTASSINVCIDTDVNGSCDPGETQLTTAQAAFFFDSDDRSAHRSPVLALSASTKYCIKIGSSLKDTAGNTFIPVADKCFTTGSNSDATAPKILFADADNFKLVAHFSEALNSTTAVNTANYTLECPVGVTINLSGKPVSYRAAFNEVEIRELGLSTNQECRLTLGSGIQDLAGNAIDAAEDTADFKILNYEDTGGFLGGSGQQDFYSGTDFGDFWEKPQRCQPRSTITGVSTTVECEFPAPQALTTGAKFILTLPSTFTVTSADDVPASQSWMNADLNGPGPGVTTISAVAADNTAHTVTVTLAHSGTVMGASDMVRFELSGITTPAAAESESRISIAVKDSGGIKVGQTINAAPFTIGQGGSQSIAGSVYKDTDGDNTKDAGEGLSGITVFCDSMGGFGSSSVVAGHQTAISDVNGSWTVSNLSNGQYGCGLQFDPTAMADLGGGASFQNVTLSGDTSKTGLDFKFSDLSSSGKTLTVSITSGAALASEEVDVFCHAGSSDQTFSAPTMKAITLNGSGAGSTTLKLQPGKTYECGVGPHIAFESFATGAEQPMPDFSFMPPKPVSVVVPSDSNPSAVTFALLAASNTITGFVRDGSNTAIANVFVHAAPLGCFESDGSKKDCFGGFTQSKSDGSFTLNVSPGTYVIGADAPGMPPSSEVEVSVATSGALTTNGASISSVTLKMVKGSLTISGVVKDESGNGVKYAHVSAQHIATGGSCSSSTPNGGFADSPTDASGNYTLYVADGTWCVRAFAPSYGEVGNKTVIVSSSSQSGQNIQATAADFGTISGTVTKGGSATSGAFVNCYGSSGGNGVQTGSDGSYSMKVKAGSGYTCEGFIHGSGPLTPQSSITVTSGGTTTVALSMGNPGTVNVTITGITDAFVDVRDSNGRGNGTNQNSAGVYTIKVPAGTYTVRGGGPRYGELCAAQTVTVTAGGTNAVTCSPPANLRTVTGRVTNGSTNVAGATVTFISSNTGRAFMTTTSAVTGSSNNISLANVPNDTYNVIASKSGYEPATTTMTVASGSTALSSALAMTAASGANGTNVTVTVQLSGSAYTGAAKVIATKSSKTVVAETEKTTGQASVPLTNGTWSVKAVGDNGKQSAATNVTVSGGVLSGSAPTLSLSSAISGFTTTSDTSTFVPKSGGLIKPSEFTGLELNAPASTFSTSDSNTGKIEFAADPTVASIDPGTDMDFVGESGYDITPKDSGGNAIKTLSGDSVTLTLPYDDADVTAAGVEEANLKCGSFNTASQAWETFSTVVDTVNNKLTCQINHFSSFGVLGTSTVSSSTPGRYYTPGGGGSTTPAPTTPAAPSTTPAPTTPAAPSTTPAPTADTTAGTVAATPAASASSVALLRATPAATGVTAEELRSGTFAYGAARVRALATEQNVAKYLASYLEGRFGKATFNALFRKAVGKSKAWWYSYVNAYTYGGYTLDEVVAGVKTGGKTVHPAIPASAWRGSADYKANMK